jgi:hypothetical protein
LLAQLGDPVIAEVPIEDWGQLIGALEPHLMATATASS